MTISLEEAMRELHNYAMEEMRNRGLEEAAKLVESSWRRPFDAAEDIRALKRDPVKKLTSLRTAIDRCYSISVFPPLRKIP